MNRYPLWKNLLVLVVLVCGAIYALPNLYGEYPAIQISPTRSTTVDAAVLERVEQILKRANIEYAGTILDSTGAKIRFDDTEIQIRARELVQQKLGDNYTVALNLLPATPAWLQGLGAKPMYLGLDLRGGVHFLMQVDTQSVIRKAEETVADDLRRAMRDEKIRYLTVKRVGSGGIEIRFRDPAQREQARGVI